MIQLPTGSSVALDFDLACGLRLLQFDNKQEYDRRKDLIRSIAAMFGGEVASENDAETAEVW